MPKNQNKTNKLENAKIGLKTPILREIYPSFVSVSRITAA
jgi:hypothetical protein